ncbi:uncharacterized protein LOC120344064 isoform X1 [Styela clava]
MGKERLIAFLDRAIGFNSAGIHTYIADSSSRSRNVESHANSNTKILFASDYGIRWIGVFTPTPYPTAEDLLGVRNTLIGLNVTSPLNFSQCHGRKLDCLTNIIITHPIIETI